MPQTREERGILLEEKIEKLTKEDILLDFNSKIGKVIGKNEKKINSNGHKLCNLEQHK